MKQAVPAAYLRYFDADTDLIPSFHTIQSKGSATLLRNIHRNSMAPASQEDFVISENESCSHVVRPDWPTRETT